MRGERRGEFGIGLSFGGLRDGFEALVEFGLLRFLRLYTNSSSYVYILFLRVLR